MVDKEYRFEKTFIKRFCKLNCRLNTRSLKAEFCKYVPCCEELRSDIKFRLGWGYDSIFDMSYFKEPFRKP